MGINKTKNRKGKNRNRNGNGNNRITRKRSGGWPKIPLSIPFSTKKTENIESEPLLTQSSTSTEKPVTDKRQPFYNEFTRDSEQQVSKVQEREDKYKKTGFGKLASNNAANAAALAGTVATAAYVGNVLVGSLAATGVGVPLAGIIGAILVVAQVMAKMAIANSNLKTVLYDVLNIVMHCNKINQVIVLILKEFNDYNEQNQKKKYEIDNEIKDRLNEKLELLFTYLLGIGEKNMIQLLYDSMSTLNIEKKYLDFILEECLQRGMNYEKVINYAEEKQRKKSGLFGRAMGTASRVSKRTIGAQNTINEIIKDLAIINGYFMLMKSQFDMIVHHCERDIDKLVLDGIWKKIEVKPEYKAYLSLDTTEMVSEPDGQLDNDQNPNIEPSNE
jgi:hypothetical protein